MSEIQEKEYKPNLDSTYAGSEIGWVIERTNSIENRLKQVISNYISIPEKDQNQFFENVLMNNAIINLSSKVKVFSHLSKLENWPEFQMSDFQMIMKVRNAFAHNFISPTITIETAVEADGTRKEPIINSYILLESVTGSGRLESVSAKKALTDFTQAYVRIENVLIKVMAMQSNA